MTLRQWLYLTARLIGDARAIKRGRYPQRIIRKQIYKRSFRAARWLSRRVGVGR